MEYAKAKRLADRIVELLTPHCEAGRIHIAGSVRRQVYNCGDIEVVCQPKKELAAINMFEQGMLVVPGFNNAITMFADNIISGNVEGGMMKIEVKESGINLDLFLPQPHDYFRILAIRTGSVDFSRYPLAAQWVKLGWVGTEEGLRRKGQCLDLGKNKWKCMVEKPELPPVWQSEEDFFTWLTLEWVEPQNRN